jgi:transposase
MSMTRQEREKVVLDLYYNQGKNIREIAQEARMSFRDIGSILNKADEAQRKEQLQDNDDNVSDEKHHHKNSSSYLYLHKLTSYFLKEKLQYK